MRNTTLAKLYSKADDSMFDNFGNHYFPKPKYPAECNEIAEKIVSGKPPITWDDILDFFIMINKREKRYIRNCQKSKKLKKKRRSTRKWRTSKSS